MFSCFSSLESDGDIVNKVLSQAINLHAANWPCFRKICHICNLETSEVNIEVEHDEFRLFSKPSLF